MHFAYYIIDLGVGEVEGTDDERVAKEYAHSDDFYVINGNSGTWLQENEEEVEIKEQTAYELTSDALVTPSNRCDQLPEDI